MYQSIGSKMHWISIEYKSGFKTAIWVCFYCVNDISFLKKPNLESWVYSANGEQEKRSTILWSDAASQLLKIYRKKKDKLKKEFNFLVDKT